jgi:hypothetical protein
MSSIRPKKLYDVKQQARQPKRHDAARTALRASLFRIDQIDKRAFLLQGHCVPKIADADVIDELHRQFRSRVGPAQRVELRGKIDLGRRAGL